MKTVLLYMMTIWNKYYLVLVIRKDHWMEMKPFIQTKLGCLGLDNELHKITQDLGVKVWQLPIYLYHWYRGATGDKTHLL